MTDCCTKIFRLKTCFFTFSEAVQWLVRPLRQRRRKNIWRLTRRRARTGFPPVSLDAVFIVSYRMRQCKAMIEVVVSRKNEKL